MNKEAIKVVEQIIKRPLKSGEVHHIDGNKSNNDPSNLMLFGCQKDHIKWHLEHDGKEG